MSMRKLVTGLLAIAVAGTAAACSSGGSGGSGGGTTTLKIITWVNPPAVKAINKIDAEFEKANPNINVELQTAVDVKARTRPCCSSGQLGSADIVTRDPAAGAADASPRGPDDPKPGLVDQRGVRAAERAELPHRLHVRPRR